VSTALVIQIPPGREVQPLGRVGRLGLERSPRPTPHPAWDAEEASDDPTEPAFGFPLLQRQHFGETGCVRQLLELQHCLTDLFHLPRRQHL